MIRNSFVSILVVVSAAIITGCSSDNSNTGNGGNGSSSSTSGALPPPPDDGPPPGSLTDCGAFEGGNNLNVCTASYLGAANADTANAVEIAKDGHVLIAGSLVGIDYGVTPTVLEGGGEGALIRLSPSGGSVLSIAQIGKKILDMGVNSSTGEIAIAGEGIGVAVLDPEGTKVLWREDVANASRVSIGSNGLVAVLGGKTVTSFDAQGTQLGSFELADGNVEDLAVYGPASSVIVVGWNQVSGNLQQPFLRAYSPTGDVKWRDYDWTAEQAAGFGPDTRGYVVTLGRDNMLYYGGESHGGGSIHGRDPKDLSKGAPIVKFDKYNDPYNWNGSAPLSFFARLNPEDGNIMAGQFIVPRLSSGKGNGAGISAIAAREDGTVIVGGGSACCIEGADVKTINGQLAMPTYAGGGFILIASPQFDQRLAWTSWKGPGGGNGESVTGVAAWGDSFALVMTQGPGKDSGMVEGRLITSKAIQGDVGGGVSDAWFSVWPGP